MKIAGIDFPGALLNALRDGELVVFAGAGVSMGEPACLPSFKNLADMIAVGTGQALQDGDPIDHFLGRLQHEGVKVRERAAEVLSRNGLEPTELHRNLLKLYSGVEQIRVVTTNFDLLFEQAADNLFGNVPEVSRAPALPLGHRFKGIVHVHGAINSPDEHGAISPPDEMVITDLDFGRAYLNEGWARRFLVELFRNFTILFVGYSHNDTIMNYLARALPPREVHGRFALTPESDVDAQRWHLLGIKPITYPRPSEGDHSTLDEGIRRLADLIRRGAVDWHREIAQIAENPPSLDEETEDLIEYALADAPRTRFFTEAATAPEWIDWLDDREYLNPLFLDGTLSERDKIFSWWLVEQFAYSYANRFFLLIDKHNTRLHPHFWYDLAYLIGRDREASWDKDILSRWISLLLAAIQGSVNTNLLGPMDTDNLLQRIGELCIRYEMLGSLMQIFDTMMDSRFRLRGGFLLPYGDESSEDLLFNVELPLIGDYHALRPLWKEDLKPKRSQIAEPLLNRVIKHLEDRHITLCAWQKANRNWDPTSDSRSAIESHGQIGSFDSIDVLIDAARDCLEWLASNQADAAARWCDRLVCSDAPLLRRLAVHGLSKREDLMADNKIDWLLTNRCLHEWPVRCEVFRAVELVYPEASIECRKVLIKAVWACRNPAEEDPDKRKYAAKRLFDWFNRLHQSDSDCNLARQARNAVLRECPNFGDPPDQTHGNRLSSSAMQSLWTPEELLATPAADFLDNLLSFQGTEWEEPNRRGLIDNVAEAARRNFDWGLNLADALSRTEEWDAYLWSALIHSSSTMELDEDKHRKVLYWFSKPELYPKHNREIAEALYAFVKPGGPSYALNLLPRANEIAAALWPHLDWIEPIEETNDWLKLAMDYPVWDLVNFWLFGFSLWLKHQDPRPMVLSEEYRRILSGIVEDQSLPGKLGRTILMTRFDLLLEVDETWAREYLLPLFDPNSDDFQAAWDGFLNGRHPNSAVAAAMADPFLKAVERINDDLFNQRTRFIEHYIYMLVYFVEDPIDKWIPKFFQYASQESSSRIGAPMLFPREVQETKDYFAAEVGRRLQRMAEAEQQEWWQRWLKCYWKNRWQGVPAVLEAGEVAHMLNWLPHLTPVFPEAVGLAVRMPEGSLQGCRVIEELNRSNLWRRHPESVVKLLIYLRECNLPRYSWDSARDLIDNLLSLDISSKL